MMQIRTIGGTIQGHLMNIQAGRGDLVKALNNVIVLSVQMDRIVKGNADLEMWAPAFDCSFEMEY